MNCEGNRVKSSTRVSYLCVLSGPQSQLSAQVTLFHDGLHVVGNMLCSSLRRDRDPLTIKVTGLTLHF